jgi:hypothetical protein
MSVKLPAGIALVLAALLLAAVGTVYWVGDRSGCDITTDPCDRSMPPTALHWLFLPAGVAFVVGVACLISAWRVRRRGDVGRHA